MYLIGITRKSLVRSQIKSMTHGELGKKRLWLNGLRRVDGKKFVRDQIMCDNMLFVVVASKMACIVTTPMHILYIGN